MQDHDLEDIEYHLHRLQQELTKLSSEINNGKKGEYEELLREVQKLTRKVTIEIDEIEQRLEVFEQKIEEPQSSENINDDDLFFIRKEVGRNKTAIAVARGINKQKANDIKKKLEERKVD